MKKKIKKKGITIIEIIISMSIMLMVGSVITVLSINNNIACPKYSGSPF